MSKSGGPERPEAVASSNSAETMADPAVERARSRLGATVDDKWRLDSLLGIGGTSVVYAATHRNGSRAAVKILNPELSFNSQVRERFLREGYVANAVGHDGTVKVLDDDVAQDGSLFLVTELLDGEPLEERRVRLGGKLGEAEVLWLSDQLLDVIAAAHDKGIVHRDLKPDNVFLTRGGQLKVLDFGIAALREASASGRGTITGSVMGTPAYMPPEQALGLWDEVDARSDIWAWGATMFHLLSGLVVHDGRTPTEQLSRAVSATAAPLASVAPEIAAPIATIVDRALAREKERRWSDARAMQEAVRAVYLDRFATPPSVLDDMVAPLAPSDEQRRSTPTFRATALPSGIPSSLRVPWGPKERKRAALVLGGAVVVVGAIPATSALFTGRTPPPSAGAGSASAFVLVAPPAIPALETSPPSEALDAGDASGRSSPAESAPTSATSTKKSPPPRPSASPASCTPPYVIEQATGKRRWKLDCL